MLKSVADEVESQKSEGRKIEDAVKTLKNNKEANEEKRIIAQKTTNGAAQAELKAKTAEEEALEKLRQIDAKVMQMQDDAMKKLRSEHGPSSFNDNSGEKKKAGLFVLWSQSLHMYFVGVLSLFKFW